ncbi:hypothetical protein [Fibrobacter sp. UWH4]|uniref:hypothetical protein n=1 Tax=Fibrobacter sp. UWH4 TaxID=1896210 RepID=UPI0009206934|nr:hypothetical protein [Fibrobacter sp. UWH4]SHK30373.1 hypothetical protein SAMN05720762_101313 [Fibrobacter sp. UWH4]
MKNNLFVKNLWAALLVGLIALPVGAAETLFSNYAMNVTGSGKNGELWVFSRSGTYSGVTLLNLNAGSSGIQVNGSKQGQASDSMTAMQDGIYSGVLAEHRRISSGYAGKIGYVLPMYGLNDDGNHLLPAGFFSVRGTEEVQENPLDVDHSLLPEAVAEDSAMYYAVSGFAFDSTSGRLWLARGTAGLGFYEELKSGKKQGMFQLNLKTGALDTAKVNYKWDAKNNPRVLDVKLHPETGELWMATSKGLWKRSSEGKISKVSTSLDTSARVTGLWMGGNPLTIIAETSYMQKESMKGALWVLRKNAKDFAKVDFLDTAGKQQKKDVYDDGDYTVSGVAFIGKVAYVAVTSGGSVSGFFKLDSTGVRAWETDDDGKNNWLYGFETGATDRDAIITSICSFPLDTKTEGLALATYGNGISVSADSGKTWTTILNRAKLGGDLGTIRMVPSVITSGDGDQSLVSYKVSKDSKITIDVFSYDMRKIRTIVKDAPRSADKSRSTNPKEDFWDGKDKAGRPCTMGVYYVRVKDNHGHIGWGKVMTLGGHK